ncbi:MAG: hypothetical protein KIT74_11875 [Fimbriimonadales bacterium]|nr:hypothetical protein [Fimbriimonadales bacterium]
MTEIKEFAERLNDELLESALKTSNENGWAGQGAIPLEQAISLVRAMGPEILAAYDEGIIDAMPRQFAQTLRERLSNMVSYAQNTANGTPQVSEFISQAESLHQELWAWGLRYKSKKLLGFDAKIAEVKRLSAELERLLKVAEEAAGQRDLFTTIRADADRISAEIADLHSQASANTAAIEAKANEAVAKQAELDTHVAAIATKLEEATSSAASAKAKLTESQTSQEALEAYYQKVEVNETKLNKVVADAAAAVKKNDEETKALVARLVGVEEDIKQKLEKATGVTLFEAFGKRQADIKKGLPVWLYVSGGVLAVSAAYSVWLLLTADKIDTAFYVKLGFSLTFFAAITFTLRQYAKERRLEEEYAFKAAISVSLAAYRGLVEQALEKLTPEERTEYATFLTKAVGTIFDPPTERVFGDRRSRGPTDSKVLASVAETIKPITDLMKPGK